MYKKAEMGVGTLIVFIAMLLVAAVAAGVLIQTVGSLQEKALSTGQQAESQIATNALTLEVSASDGQDTNLTDFQHRMKLSPGSGPIKLDQVILAFNTVDDTATLTYRGNESICERNNQKGYNTYYDEQLSNVTGVAYTLAEDLDDDGVNDSVSVVSSTLVGFDLSSLAVNINVTIPSIAAAGAGAVTLAVNDQELSYNGTTYGYVTIAGDTNTNDEIDAAVNFTVVPYDKGEGYFSVVYEQTGTNHVAGNLQRGDVIRLCYEAPGVISEDEVIRLNFIPKIGASTLTEIVTPDVISTERVYLYP